MISAVQTETVKQFTLNATAYCSLLEDHCAFSAKQFVREAARLLLELYRLGLALPAVNTPDVDEPQLPSDSTKWIIHNIVDKVGSVQFYRELFNPYDFEDTSPVAGDIADDLADIYLDLKRGLLSFNRGTEDDQVFAVGYWTLHMMHWGRHTVDVLRALHWIITDDLLSKN